jgi:GNAT superfamily N-acetyltransferase
VPVREDTWLSERFGHPVFCVEHAGELAERRAPATYQARVDVGDTGRAASLQAAGMRVVNTSVTLAADPARSLAPGPVEIRPADPDRDEALPDIAGRSFRYDRFHLDSEVPPAVADRIKRDWVSSYLAEARGDALLVAERGGRPIGFLCALVRDGVNVVDLIGVAPEAQGSGAGKSLMAALHERAAGGRVEVGTQAANVPATAFYERLGYVASRSAYDLHMHT